MSNDYVIGRSRHPWLCRWWVRTRPVKPDKFHRAMCRLTSSGARAPVEFYVPWWGWPLELLHRAVFGRAIIRPLDEGAKP